MLVENKPNDEAAKECFYSWTQCGHKKVTTLRWMRASQKLTNKTQAL
jgi:hypothetical protein